MNLPAPYFQDQSVTLYCGDMREIVQGLSGITAVVTDPPYELGFMGKEWDRQGVSFDCETWRRISACCLPGAPLLAFGGTRTWHRMVCAIEDAGWEVRDTLMWLYGSGFPKSLDISKAIDRELGSPRDVAGVGPSIDRNALDMGGATGKAKNGLKAEWTQSEPNTDAAKEWQGYGTALKPAWEPICLAMKPLDGTFAHNALTHGVAGLNIDGSRIEGAKGTGVWGSSNRMCQEGRIFNGSPDGAEYRSRPHDEGRFPANLLLDEVSGAMLDEQSGELRSGTAVGGLHRRSNKTANCYGRFVGQRTEGDVCYGDMGGASRFFYCSKASKGERGEGNDHPTVKPIALMAYLIRLVSPPQNGLTLDPFMGSGTTGLACQKLGVRSIGIDISERNCEIAARRLQRSRVLC